MLLCSSALEAVPVYQNRQPPSQRGITMASWALSCQLRTDLLCPRNTMKSFHCFGLQWQPIKKLYSSSRLLKSPGDGRRGVSGVVAVNIFLHSNYGQKNQGRTDGRQYRHFRTRNGVIFLNGNSWPPLKSFIICFRICTKSLETWRKREFCLTTLK